MKATVDPNRCDIAGICVVICPEVFRFHEGSKKAYVTRSEIPKNLNRNVWKQQKNVQIRRSLSFVIEQANQLSGRLRTAARTSSFFMFSNIVKNSSCPQGGESFLF